MKFLCDNCKAKYQIADEKLHGRAVQMKCRKCGHMIEVPAIMAPAQTAAAPEAQAPAAPPAPVAAPAAATAAPAPGVTRPSAPKPAVPKPSISAPARPVRPTPGPVARPQTVAPSATASNAAPAPAAPEAAPKSATAGALAGAFAKTVKETEVSAAIEVLSAGAAEEWYVGINGVPLGPVRLSVLRQKASQGLVNEESLVWREGFDEWLPLRTFPELCVLVQEAREHAVRPVLTPAAPQAQRISAVPQPPRAHVVAPAPAPVAAAQVAAPAAPPAHAFKDVAAAAMVAGQRPAAAPAAPAPQPAAPAPAQPVAAASVDVLADPFAAKPSAASQASPASAPAAAVEAEPAARHSVAPERHSVIDGIAGGVKRQVRLHPAAVAFMVLLGVLGGVLLTVMLVGNKQPPVAPTVQIVTVTAPAATAPGAAPVASGGAGIALPENAIVGENSKTGGVRLASAKDAGTNGTSEKAPGDQPPPMNVGLQDMPGMAGPNVAGPTAGGGNQSLPALEQSDIQRVVSQNVGFVRRQCWEPALASKSPNAPSSAKVTVAITIGADGSVQSASASGGGGYPDLASCVGSRVRGWRFPPSSGTSNASVPFVFAAQ